MVTRRFQNFRALSTATLCVFLGVVGGFSLVAGDAIPALAQNADGDGATHVKKDVVLIAPPTVHLGESLVISLQRGRNQKIREGFPAAFADILTKELAAARIATVDRQALDQLLREQGLSYQGIVDPDTAAKTGKQLGARYLLSGSVDADIETKDLGLRKNYRVLVSFRLVDIETGKILATIEAKGEERLGAFADESNDEKAWLDSPLGKACRNAGDDLVKKLRAESDVFKPRFSVSDASSDTEVIVDGGKMGGLQKGMKVVVYRIRRIGSYEKRTPIADGVVDDAQDDGALIKIVLKDPTIKASVGDIVMIAETEEKK